MVMDNGINQTKYAGMAVHLIGAGGSGMRALGQMLMEYGASVSGSDMAENAGVALLRQAGASIQVGQRGENIPPQTAVVVYSQQFTTKTPNCLKRAAAGWKW